MKRAFLGTLALLCLAGCTQTNPSPETIRQDTAKATNEAVRDAKDLIAERHGVIVAIAVC